MARGKTEHRRHLNGLSLTPLQAIRAKCYECMAGYADGRTDCGITSCPLHPFMPYSPDRRFLRSRDKRG